MPTQPKPTPTSTNASTPTDKPPALSPITPQTTTPLQLTLHHLHTLLPLLLLVSTFRPLVSNPPATLLTLLLPPLAITQSLYIAICLPPSAGTASITPTSSKPKKNHAQTKNWTSRVVPTLISLTSALTLPPPLLFTLLIAHGAPLTSHLEHTFLLATHLSLLATPALFYTRGLSAPSWRQIVSLSAPVDSVQGAAMGTILGAWLGAVPIPLDWDREWQAWPVTVVVGAYVGYAMGKMVGGGWGWGRRVEFVW